MKAAVLTALNEPLVVADVGLTPLSRGQVLVKVLVTGICGAQLEEMKGHKGNAKFVPHLLGHEACGIVEEIGEGVTKVTKGDKVVMHWRQGEGIDSEFPKYVYNGSEISSGKMTTFSEYSIVSENRVTPVPPETPNDLAALMGCALSTGLGVVEGAAKVRPGESVIVIGAGGIGLNVIRAARNAGGTPVIAVDIADKKTLAEGVGATHFIHTGTTTLAEGLQVLGMKNADIIICTITDPKTIEDSIPLLAPSGRYVLVGQPVPGEPVTLLNASHFMEGEGKTLMGTQSGGFNPTRDIPRYLNMVEEGNASIEGIITQRITLDHINEAIEEIEAGRAGRILIDF